MNTTKTNYPRKQRDNSMRKGACLGILLVLALTCPSFAGEKTVLTLRESIQRALTYNLSVQIARIELKEAHLELDKNKASFKPQASMSASPLGWQGDKELLEYSPSAGLEARLHTQGGTEITLSVTEGMQEAETMKTSLSLGLTQQIIPSPQHHSSLLSLEKSRLSLEQEKLTSEEKIENVKLEVMTIFYQILQQEKERELAEISLQHAEENVRITEDKREKRMANELDVLDAQMQRIKTEEALFQAKSNLSQSMRDLKELVGIDPKTEIVLEDGSTIEYHPLTLKMEDVLEEALENNLQINQQELAVRIHQLDLTLSEANISPSLDIVADYGYNTQGQDKEEYKVGLVAEIPLLDGGEGKANIQIAEQKVRKAKLTLEKLTQDTCAIIREYFYELERMEKKVASLGLSREKERKAFSITEKMLSEGAATSQEVQDRKISSVQAEIDYLQALADYEIAKAELLRSIGREI